MQITCVLNEAEIKVAIANYLRTYQNLNLIKIIQAPATLTVEAEKVQASSYSIYDR